MTTPAASPAPVRRVTAHDLGQLATCVPYLLGYDPAGGVVAIGMSRSPDGRPVMVMGPAARVALDPLTVGDDAASVWSAMVLRMVEHCDALVLLGWMTGPVGAGEAGTAEMTRLLHGLADRAEADGLDIMDLALVGDGCWRPVTCPDPTCCPQDLIELPASHQLGAVAEMMLAGRAPLADRDAVLAQADAAPEELRSRLVRAALRPGECFGAGDVLAPLPGAVEGCGAWRRLLALDGDRVPGRDDPAWAADVASAALMVGDIRARDVLLTWLCPRGWGDDDLVDPWLLGVAREHLGPRVDGRDEDRARAVLDRMVAMCRALPDPEAADVLTLTAMLAWSVGEALLAEGAFTRAVRADPGQSLATTMLGALAHGVRYRDLVESPRRMG